MKEYINVHSNAEPLSIEITPNKVFIAKNISLETRIDERNKEMTYFSYDLLEYDKDEYLKELHQNQIDVITLQEELQAAKILLGVE